MNDEPVRNNRPKFVTEVVEDPSTLPPQPTDKPKIDPHAPMSHVDIPGNKLNEPHIFQKMFFLIPAILIVVTIAGVAYLTRKDFVIREEVRPVESLASALPTVQPTSTPKPKINNKFFENSLFIFSYSEELNLYECGEQIYLTKYPNLSKNEGISLEEDFCIDPDSFENAISIETVDANLEVIEAPVQDENTKLVLAGDKNLVITLINSSFKDEFEKVVNSVKILIDLTLDWEIFENKLYGYNLKYPPEWNLVNTELKDSKITSRSIIRKDLEEIKLQNLVIEVQLGLENASLTATETASSTKGLLGWKEKPKTEIRTTGGANSQIIRGEFDGNWVEYIVVWHKNIVIQMTWTDSLDKANQRVFNDILESFELI